MATRYTVKRTGRSWGVYRGAELIEGGFFSQHAAVDAADRENRAEDARRNSYGTRAGCERRNRVDCERCPKGVL